METEVLGGKPSLLQRVGHFANSLKKIYFNFTKKIDGNRSTRWKTIKLLYKKKWLKIFQKSEINYSIL